MQFHSPERPRLENGRPTWLARQVALPDIHISPAPEGDGLWQVELVLVDQWVGGIFGWQGVEGVLKDWRDDPETALREWFKVEPPRERANGPLEIQESAGTASKTAEELDL